MAIGLRQLAAICDVSHTTVSRALKDDPRISEAVRTRVRRIAASYNYRPNHLVKGVMSGKSQCIAVVLADSSRDVGGILSPIQQFFLGKSYSTLVYNTINKPELELLSFHEAVCHRVEGLIIAPADQQAKEKYFKELRRSDLPFVIIGPNVEEVNVPHVAADDEGSSANMIDYLCELGHRSIAMLRGSITHDVIDKRYQGYLKSMQRNGNPINLDWIKSNGWKPSDAEQATIELMKLPEPPTALFCVNDSLGMGALKGLASLGIRVPEDVSVTGMGDDYFSPYLTPALTTTSRAREQVGLAAARQLWEMLQNPGKKNGEAPPLSSQTTIPIMLIKRDSTGPAPTVKKKRR